jgi:glycosyltransferase involved in cell wall biosynthesis
MGPGSGHAGPQLSLIVPVYNAAPFIEESISTIIAALDSLEQTFEILVVCDGCSDGTAAIVQGIVDPRLRVVKYTENRGKGYAICSGVVRARGRLVGWLDADLDIYPGVIVEAVRRFDQRNIDAVIGSKRHRESQVDYPAKRRLLSTGFQLLVRVLFRINVRDTQVGAKVFRAEMLATVVPLLLIKQYAFDLEVLAVGAEFGFDRIEEAPVRLDYRFTGTGITKRTVQRMFFDTLAIAYRIHVRHWYVRQFAALQRARAEASGEADSLPLAPPRATLSEILSLRA